MRMRYQKASVSSSDPVQIQGVGAAYRNVSMEQERGEAPIAIAVPAWELHERAPYLQMKTKDSLIVAGSVVGTILLFCILICAFFTFRKIHKRRNSDVFSSDECGIKASVSTPSLSTVRKGKDPVVRSRSVETSVSSSPSEVISSYYPQPDINESWIPGANTSSSSSPSMADPYSPFQRSFHIENLPFLDLFVRKTKEHLTVAVRKFLELPDNVLSASGSTSSGLFVKAYLLPDEICQQTKIHPTTGADEQVLNDVLSFEDTKSNNCLLLSAYFIDTRQMRVSLGHATVPLENEDHEKACQVRLEELANMLHYGVGELEITITFLPDRSRLAVILNSCKNLTLTDVRPSSKLMIRVQFFQGRKVAKEKYFRVMKMERNPVLNESCFFKMPNKRADISHLRFALVEAGDDEDRNIGQIAIGPYLYARGEGLLHWQTVLSNAKQSTTMSHLFEAPTDF